MSTDGGSVTKKQRGMGLLHGSWLLYAVLSAVFASLTAILGKVGISDINSNLGTAIRTTVVLVMAWLMVFVSGKQHEIKGIEKKELLFIALSGIATGASWLCYYRALQLGHKRVKNLMLKLVHGIMERFYVSAEKNLA